ncbi:hypothetical protein NSX52_23985, partial [Salmonella enterica]|nr:hypothetical protein [Salmonella enterica]
YVTPAAEDARIRLQYRAAEVRMVVAGSGEVVVTDADGNEQTIRIDGTPRSYGLLVQDDIEKGTFTLEVPAGVEVYSFTFG